MSASRHASRFLKTEGVGYRGTAYCVAKRCSESGPLTIESVLPYLLSYFLEVIARLRAHRRSGLARWIGASSPLPPREIDMVSHRRNLWATVGAVQALGVT